MSDGITGAIYPPTERGLEMLVLSRKEGERVLIGPEIEVTVLGIHKGRVKLGFSGPPEVPILRGELRRRVGHARVERQTAQSLKSRSVA